VKGPTPGLLSGNIASAGGAAPRRLSPASWWLLGVVCFETAIALSARLPLVFGQELGIRPAGGSWRF
jgi:hypothetical protein